MNQEDRKKLEDLENRIDEVIKGIDRIETGLFGDEKMGQPGLVNRVVKLEETATKLENAKWYVLGGIAVIGAVAGLIAWITDLYSKIKG